MAVTAGITSGQGNTGNTGLMGSMIGLRAKAPATQPQTNTLPASQVQFKSPLANTAGSSQFNNKSTLNPTNQTFGSTYGKIEGTIGNALGNALIPGYNNIKSALTGTANPPAPQAQAHVTLGSNSYDQNGNQVNGTQTGSGTSSDPYAMTPSEASGGATGLAAYNARISALNNTSGGSGTTGSTGSTGTQPIAPTLGAGSTQQQSIIEQLINAYQNNPQVTAAQQALQDTQNQYNQLTKDNSTNPGILSLATGRQGALNTEYNADLAAAQSRVAAAQQGVANQISGLSYAGGLNAPVSQYGALTNPVTGEAISGGATGGVLPAAGQQAVNTFAQQVQNGQMTYQQALSNLSAYGQAGVNALTQALGSNFNTNASNASGATTAAGQQIQTAAASANSALDTLGNAFASLPGVSTQGIPGTISIANWIQQQFGSAALQSYNTALDDARSQLVGVLNSAGGTPTGNEATANQYLPDNMTQAQFNQNVGTAQNPGIVRQLLQQKVSAFVGSGSQGTNTNGTSNTSSLYNF
jgi:hypothetical protein